LEAEMLTEKFVAKLKLSERPAYRIAAECGVDPSFLSRAIHGAVRVERGDARLLKIGKALGLSAKDVFVK
jgi:hypothetical protein